MSGVLLLFPGCEDDTDPGPEQDAAISTDQAITADARVDSAAPDLALPDLTVPDLTVPDLAIPDLPPPSCTDKIKNGDETDIDCGGSTCPKCGKAKACTKADDCLSGVCTGEGSADEDGYKPGAGGFSGGVVYIRAKSAAINGTINVGGGKGGNGTNSCSGCGGAGMAGGGGGAAGSIYLRTTAAVLGTNSLVAPGGAKGLAGGWTNHGGVGSVGRIRVDFATINGSALGTSAATSALKNSTHQDAHGGKATP